MPVQWQAMEISLVRWLITTGNIETSNILKLYGGKLFNKQCLYPASNLGVLWEVLSAMPPINQAFPHNRDIYHIVGKGPASASVEGGDWTSTTSFLCQSLKGWAIWTKVFLSQILEEGKVHPILFHPLVLQPHYTFSISAPPKITKLAAICSTLCCCGTVSYSILYSIQTPNGCPILATSEEILPKRKMLKMFWN